MVPTLEWTPDGVRFIDQTRLPLEETYVLARTHDDVAHIIRTMVVRGAPAIGVAAAMGVALAAKNLAALNIPPATLQHELETVVIPILAGTRPTAVNLFWALERMHKTLDRAADSQDATSATIAATLIREANNMFEEDIAACRSMGAFGAELLPSHGGVLTHCNAGALATCGYGSALGVIRAAIERGQQIEVFADETRPFLQGARLTAWELQHDNIPTTVICDNMAATTMRQGRIHAVIVGADRIAANGDVANKVGTYGVAILAKEHGIPFYVAAPWSTIDLNTPTGDQIPIEQRAAEEVTHHGGRQMTPNNIAIENPAFDVTPAKYVTAIITERGILRAPYSESLARMADLAAV
jgi:methylthioribose-1-phosphate isomerase